MCIYIFSFKSSLWAGLCWEGLSLFRAVSAGASLVVDGDGLRTRDSLSNVTSKVVLALARSSAGAEGWRSWFLSWKVPGRGQGK